MRGNIGGSLESTNGPWYMYRGVYGRKRALWKYFMSLTSRRVNSLWLSSCRFVGCYGMVSFGPFVPWTIDFEPTGLPVFRIMSLDNTSHQIIRMVCVRISTLCKYIWSRKKPRLISILGTDKMTYDIQMQRSHWTTGQSTVRNLAKLRLLLTPTEVGGGLGDHTLQSVCRSRCYVRFLREGPE